MTLVYAHRGASSNAPENTMAAFLLAIAQGADGIELDVHLTKDLIPVVMHDETLERTSNGKGYIKDYTFEELRKLDCNNHMLMPNRCVIPSLEEVVILAKKNNIILNIEIKSDIIAYRNIEKIVYDVVEKHGYQKNVLYSSFNPQSLVNLKNINTDVYCGLLYSIKNDEIIKIAKNLGIDGLHPHHKLINEALIRKCRKANLEIYCWTVNAYDSLEKMISYNLNGIITNYLLRARQIIG